MKKLFLSFAFVVAAGSISASDINNNKAMDFSQNYVEQNFDDEDYEKILEGVKKGNRECVQKLIDCYLEGKGVKKSVLNAMVLYISLQKDLSPDVLEKFFLDIDQPDNFLCILVKSGGHKHLTESIKNEILKKCSNSAANTAMFKCVLLIDSSPIIDQELIMSLQEAMNKGSEEALLLLAIMYEDQKNTERLIDLVSNYGDTFPFFYYVLGETLYEEYKTQLLNEGIMNTKKLCDAEHYMFKAYNKGFLLLKGKTKMLEIHCAFQGLNYDYDDSIDENLKNL